MAKTKAQISFAVTAKLICVFVFAYAKSRFSHDAAHLQCGINEVVEKVLSPSQIQFSFKTLHYESFYFFFLNKPLVKLKSGAKGNNTYKIFH